MPSLKEAMAAAQNGQEVMPGQIDVADITSENSAAEPQAGSQAPMGEAGNETTHLPAMDGPQQDPVTNIVQTTPATPAVVRVSPLEALAEKKMEEIRKLNPDFNLDFMNVFTRLKTDTKGRFVYSLSGEDFVLTDKIKIRLLAGDYMHQYWGEKDTEQEGTLVCYSKDGKHHSIDGIPCDQCPYKPENCHLRFAIALNLLEEGEDPDEVYNLNMPQTGAFAFADYVKLVTKKFKKGLKDVITEMRTEEKEGKEKGQKFNAILFRISE